MDLSRRDAAVLTPVEKAEQSQAKTIREAPGVKRKRPELASAASASVTSAVVASKSRKYWGRGGAGVMLLCKLEDGPAEALLLERAGRVDEPGQYGIAGGGVDEANSRRSKRHSSKESLSVSDTEFHATALKEAREELGPLPEWFEERLNNATYTDFADGSWWYRTFVVVLSEPERSGWHIVLNSEHCSSIWADAREATLYPLHFGVIEAAGRSKVLRSCWPLAWRWPSTLQQARVNQAVVRNDVYQQIVNLPTSECIFPQPKLRGLNTALQKWTSLQTCEGGDETECWEEVTWIHLTGVQAAQSIISTGLLPGGKKGFHERGDGVYGVIVRSDEADGWTNMLMRAAAIAKYQCPHAPDLSVCCVCTIRIPATPYVHNGTNGIHPARTGCPMVTLKGIVSQGYSNGPFIGQYNSRWNVPKLLNKAGKIEACIVMRAVDIVSYDAIIRSPYQPRADIGAIDRREVALAWQARMLEIARMRDAQRAYEFAEYVHLAITYAQQHGNHCSPPQRHPKITCRDGIARDLGKWVTNTRREYKASKLSRDRIEALEKVPGWSWNS
jgi:8-oxo-dGTP pyrophosphatase MutT (NUDIX family)